MGGFWVVCSTIARVDILDAAGATSDFAVAVRLRGQEHGRCAALPYRDAIVSAHSLTALTPLLAALATPADAAPGPELQPVCVWATVDVRLTA